MSKLALYTCLIPTLDHSIIVRTLGKLSYVPYFNIAQKGYYIGNKEWHFKEGNRDQEISTAENQ